MRQRPWPSAPPRKILLTTDLSASSDRALDRAVELARRWNAGLVVLHPLECQAETMLATTYEDFPSWRRPPDHAATVERQIRRDMREVVADLSTIVAEGDLAELALEVARRERCDLIVLGAARNGRVARNVEHLIRRAQVSVLVVKSRVSGRYNHIVAGVDFTEESRHGLSIAATMFPDAIFAVIHASELPYRSISGAAQLRREISAMEMEEIRAFVAETEMPKSARTQVATLIEHGPPEIMIRNYVIEQNADLVVIGAIGRGMLFQLLIGGKAPKIMDASPSDVLIVSAQPRVR